MNKISLSILAIFGVSFASFSYCGTMGPINAQPKEWTGFYVGPNAGYWWSANKAVNTLGTSSYVNPLFSVGALSITNALATAGTHGFSIDSDGFIGGGQVGFNYQLHHQFVVGLEADIEGLSQSRSNAQISQEVVLADFPTEYYDANISVTKKLDYLGTLRGRLGYLWSPALLLYGTGGMAYGGASLSETFNVQSSLGSPSYIPIVMQNHLDKTRIGWTAGGGLEWMFRPNWSAKIEGIYYDLGTINTNVILSQISELPIPPVVIGSATINSTTRFTAGAVRVGLNYHC